MTTTNLGLAGCAAAFSAAVFGFAGCVCGQARPASSAQTASAAIWHTRRKVFGAKLIPFLLFSRRSLARATIAWSAMDEGTGLQEWQQGPHSIVVLAFTPL